ncbi:hypothetical protein QTP88_024172 [Uroleucon formosanum]
MVQDIVKNLGMKLRDLILTIENTSILRSTLFMVLCVLAVQLDCNKISKFSQPRKVDELPGQYQVFPDYSRNTSYEWINLYVLIIIHRYQERLGYCQKFDNFKCENGGIRMYSKENGLSCWCTPDYFGEYCQTKKPVSLFSRIISLFRLRNSDISRGKPTMWWSIFPFTSGLQLKTIYAFHQIAVKRLENAFPGDNNDGYDSRILPSSCPLECCANDKSLPPLNTLYNKILKRKSGQFKKERKNNNLLLDAFYRYFVLQFCGTNSNLKVTASQLYGNDAVSERAMRSFFGGKLKTRKYNNKHYAKNDVFTLQSDVYLKASTNGILTSRSWLSRMIAQKSKQPETLSTNTMLYVLSTIWVREHNRVCDKLSQKWPTWTDQELYATARKIVTGQMMTIMMNEVMNVELRPKVYDDQMENIRVSGMPIELYLMMAVSNLPEILQYSSSNLTSFSKTRPYFEDGLVDTLQFMVNSEMDMVTAHNEGESTEELIKTLMTLSREQCVQGFNNYRRRLGLAAYDSFFDLTGSNETATELEKVYSSVENVELVTGMLTEKSSSGVLPTIKALSNKNTGILRFTFFMVLSVLAVHLDCNKIRYQEYLGYCKKIDNFKCENGGIRMYSKENGLSCWCTPDYFGEYCQRKTHVSFISRTVSLFRFGNSEVSRGKPTMWWKIFPFTSGLQLKTIYAFHQSAVNRLENVFASDNNDEYGSRILPSSCPLECCANEKSLPPLNTLYNKILKRKSGQFKKERKNNNLLLDAFYRYFVLQFCGTNSNLKVTASQLYGNDAVSERAMRSFSGGKLMTRKYNNKHYAKNDVFALRSDVYLKASTNGILTGRSWLHNGMIAQKSKQPETLSTNTMLYVLSTIWVREHNRVCDELSQKWPTWTDQELYATARNIVTGQMMTIMMNDVMNVELRPKVYDDQMKNIRVSDTPIELYLTMAVSNLPKKMQYSSSNLTSFSNTRPYFEDGLVDTLQFMVNSEMDMVTAHNEGESTEELIKTLMTLSREQCVQGFNNYRRRLGLAAYDSFFDLTGSNETATELEKVYSSVENVELVTGMLTEKSSSGVLPTIKALSNSYIINSILTNHLTSKHSWAPDMFGGVEFFDLVKSTSLKSLVCRNVGMTFKELQVYLNT